MIHRYKFRFDDISLNTDGPKLEAMIAFLQDYFGPDHVDIELAVSPAVFDMSNCTGLEKERVFPATLNREADFRKFYRVEKVGVPDYIWKYRGMGAHFWISAHGMVHVDHRLLSGKAQELSIVTSCALTKSNSFVPPFHKWNEKTEAVCQRHNIHLEKLEPINTAHLLYHKFYPTIYHYYLHTHDFTYEDFIKRFSSQPH